MLLLYILFNSFIYMFNVGLVLKGSLEIVYLFIYIYMFVICSPQITIRRKDDIWCVVIHYLSLSVSAPSSSSSGRSLRQRDGPLVRQHRDPEAPRIVGRPTSEHHGSGVRTLHHTAPLHITEEEAAKYLLGNLPSVLECRRYYCRTHTHRHVSSALNKTSAASFPLLSGEAMRYRHRHEREEGGKALEGDKLKGRAQKQSGCVTWGLAVLGAHTKTSLFSLNSPEWDTSQMDLTYESWLSGIMQR